MYKILTRNYLLNKSFIVFFLLMLSILINAQSFTTQIQNSSIRVCQDTSQLTVNIINNGVVPLEDGYVLINLNGLVFNNFLGRIGYGAAPTITYAAGTPDTVFLDGDLLPGDELEFAISFTTNSSNLNSGPIDITTTFVH
nr:hypothetical protein [Saprospiraceae bacterium]